MTKAPEKVWDFWPHDGGNPVLWREPCPFPSDDAEVFEYTRTDLADARIADLEATLQEERSAKWEILEHPLKNRVVELETALKSVLKAVDDDIIMVRLSERTEFMELLGQLGDALSGKET
tara:strand:+ start:5943 stop:6302 length:360 start_codon:yes stop_codon:yes gene_type:complete